MTDVDSNRHVIDEEALSVCNLLLSFGERLIATKLVLFDAFGGEAAPLVGGVSD